MSITNLAEADLADLSDGEFAAEFVEHVDARMAKLTGEIAATTAELKDLAELRRRLVELQGRLEDPNNVDTK